MQRNLEDTLLELQRTARALRVLSDYLQQHPEVAAARQARRRAGAATLSAAMRLRLHPLVARRVRCGAPARRSALLALAACGTPPPTHLHTPDADRARAARSGAPAREPAIVVASSRSACRRRSTSRSGWCACRRRLAGRARAGALGQPAARRVPPGAARGADRRLGRGRGAQRRAGAGRRCAGRDRRAPLRFAARPRGADRRLVDDHRRRRAHAARAANG